MRFGINCGHTASGAGYGAVGLLKESAETRLVGREVMRILKELGHTVVDCTIDVAATQSAYLQRAVALANDTTLDWFISIHFNAAANTAAGGVEVYTYGGRQFTDALEVCQNLAKLGFKNRGVKDGSGLYVVNKTKAKSQLIEVCFVTNPADVAAYKKHGYKAIAQAICHALVNYTESPMNDPLYPEATVSNGVVSYPNGTKIMGSNELSVAQMRAYIRKYCKNPEAFLNLPYLFLTEAAKEGVRGDLLFCQACHETGTFNFGGDVKPEQHNYAGLGAVGGGAAGAAFATEAEGILAQAQHAKGYATTAALTEECVDPRYYLLKQLSKLGTAPTVESLSGKWAVPGYPTSYASLEAARAAGMDYGSRIMKIYKEIKSIDIAAAPVVEEPVVDTSEHSIVLNAENAKNLQKHLAALGITCTIK